MNVTEQIVKLASNPYTLTNYGDKWSETAQDQASLLVWLHIHAYIIREVVGSLARNGRTILKDFWASCNAIYFFCSEDEIVALHPCGKNESSAKLNVFFFFKAHELLFFLSHTDYIQCMDLRYSHFSSGSKYATLKMFNK